MTLDQIINRVSLALGILSIIAVILTGFLGEIVTSIVIGICAILLWLSWLTYRLLKLPNEETFSKNSSNVVEESVGLSYQAHYQELSSVAHHISTRIDKLKFPAEFFEWSHFSIVFWARIDQEFVNNRYNKYLFSYTSNSESASRHPNSFYLGVKGGQAYFRFVISGEDPTNSTHLQFGAGHNYLGWKLFAVKWDLSTRVLDLSIDAGRTHRVTRKLEEGHWPQSVENCEFHFGGWLDTWDGGLSNLDFYNFRIYYKHLSNNDIETILEKESKLLEEME